MDNAADRKSIRAKEKASRLADQNRREVLVGIMSTTFGREWVWNQLERAHVFEMSFTPDALLTAFREGERNQGQLLLNDVMVACPEQFIIAMRESNVRRTQRDITPTSTSSGSAGELDGSSDTGRYVEGSEADSDLGAEAGSEAHH